MIVPMAKVHAACRRSDTDRLMTALRDLGVVHLAPVERTAAVPDEATTARIEQLGRAVQALQGIAPVGETPRMTAAEAAAEVLRVQRESAERHSRLNTLHRQAEQLAVWGDLRLEQLPHGVDGRLVREVEVPLHRLLDDAGRGAHTAVVEVDVGAVHGERLLDLAPVALVRRHRLGGGALGGAGGGEDALHPVVAERRGRGGTGGQPEERPA